MLRRATDRGGSGGVLIFQTIIQFLDQKFPQLVWCFNFGMRCPWHQPVADLFEAIDLECENNVSVVQPISFLSVMPLCFGDDSSGVRRETNPDISLCYHPKNDKKLNGSDHPGCGSYTLAEEHMEHNLFMIIFKNIHTIHSFSPNF